MHKRFHQTGLISLVLLACLLSLLLPWPAAQAQTPSPTPTRTPVPINVGNFVWDDRDKDGQQDPGEPGLAGVTVQLWNAAKTLLIDSTVTNSSGLYSLSAPAPGTYRVRVLLPDPADFFTIMDGAGGDDTIDSDINPSGPDQGFTNVYTFQSNLISITSIDAGIVKYHPPTPTRTPIPINLGNFVWHDLNGNGIQDSGEPGVGGVVVQLWNSAKTLMFQSTTTNSSGNYSLLAPVPGDYRIRVIPPPGASFSPANQGPDDTRDSDINPAGVDAGFTHIISIAPNVISITSLDAGLVNVVPSPTPSPTGTPQPGVNQKVYLPGILR